LGARLVAVVGQHCLYGGADPVRCPVVWRHCRSETESGAAGGGASEAYQLLGSGLANDEPAAS
jgi:hypothetical protein